MVDHGFQHHFAAPLGPNMFYGFSKHRTCKSMIVGRKGNDGFFV